MKRRNYTQDEVKELMRKARVLSLGEIENYFEPKLKIIKIRCASCTLYYRYNPERYSFEYSSNHDFGTGRWVISSHRNGEGLEKAKFILEEWNERSATIEKLLALKDNPYDA